MKIHFTELWPLHLLLFLMGESFNFEEEEERRAKDTNRSTTLVHLLALTFLLKGMGATKYREIFVKMAGSDALTPETAQPAWAENRAFSCWRGLRCPVLKRQLAMQLPRAGQK